MRRARVGTHPRSAHRPAVASGYRSPVTSQPPDVAVAHAIRALTRALLVCCAAVGALGLAGVAVLTLGAASADGLMPALSLLAVGQVVALAGGVVVVLGLRATLRPSRARRGPDASSATVAPTHATPDDAARAAAAGAVVARRLGLLARLLLVALVVAVAGWAFADGASALGALLGALVSAQVAVVFVVVGRRLSPPAAAASAGAPGAGLS